MARLVDHGRAGGDPDFYFKEFTAPAGCELTDRDAWAAANPMLGDTLDPAHPGRPGEDDPGVTVSPLPPQPAHVAGRALAASWGLGCMPAAV